MKKLLIIGFFWILSWITHAEIQVQIDPAQVGIDESFRLTLSQDNLQNGGIPDLTPLQNDFIILGTERHINYSLVNGQTQSSTSWTITLRAQKEGTLTIPALKVGREYTAPATINVNATNDSGTPNNATEPAQQQGLYLTTATNQDNPYVNQQIIYKVTIYNSKQLLDADYQGPQVENALLIPLGAEKRYQTEKNNTTYMVEEQNYAIFPQKSGPLTIKSPVFSALVYDFNPERVIAQDRAINLDVRPISKEFSGKTWLPATGIKLYDQYESPATSIAQGNTLVRTVTLEANGVPAQLLPALSFAEIDGINVYPEKGKDKNQIVQGALIGRTEVKITYLFNKAGTMTIPELKLPWFNTTTGKEEIATLPAKVVEVSASANTATDNSRQATETPVANEQQTPIASNKIRNSTWNWAWIAALFFASAWLATLILWGWQKRSSHIGRGRYKARLNELQQACMHTAPPEQVRDALLKWARLHWPDATILNLTDVLQLSHDAAFKKQVQLLSQALYKNQEQHRWRGDELWRGIQQMKKNTPPKKEAQQELPPLNPY